MLESNFSKPFTLVLRFFLPPRQGITSLAYPDGFRQAQALWLCQIRQSGLSAPSPCCGKHFRLVSCLENFIVHGEVAVDAARFRISPALVRHVQAHPC